MCTSAESLAAVQLVAVVLAAVVAVVLAAVLTAQLLPHPPTQGVHQTRPEGAVPFVLHFRAVFGPTQEATSQHRPIRAAAGAGERRSLRHSTALLQAPPAIPFALEAFAVGWEGTRSY